MIGLTLLFGLLILMFGDWSRPARYLARSDVWPVVEREASRHDLDPDFVFSVVGAESSFNSRARNGDARGLMQLRPIAWDEVSDRPHRHAWRWEANIEVGTAYLAHLREFLHEHGRFSYPLLAACYRHGPYRVKDVEFQLDRLPSPHNEIYAELQQGNLSPLGRP